MKKQLSALEWQLCDGQGLDDPAWEALLAPPDPPAPEAHGGEHAHAGANRARRWPALALFLVLLCWWAGWPANADPPRVELSTPEAIQVSSPLETIYFRFYFHPHDVQAVQTVAARLDRQYERLRQEFALGPLPVGNKVTIKVGFPITSSPQIPYPLHSDNVLVVPVRMLSATGAAATEAALTRITENWLAGRALDEAIQRTTPHPRWQLLLDSFRHIFWLRQREDHVLRSEWIYISLQHPLPTAPVWTTTLTAQIGYEAMYTYTAESIRDFAVTTSLADYLLTAYGRQQLPDLLAGFGRYDTWEELSPAVFGVAASELEAGWHAYLEKSRD